MSTDEEIAEIDKRYARSRSTSPIESPNDTNARPAGRVMAFYVRDFEDRNAPLMLLDSYIQKSKGWPNIRSRAMVPEQFIERLPFKSPCLYHGNDDQLDDEDLEDALSDQDIEQVPIEDDEVVDAGHVEPEKTDFTNDPSYLHFKRRLDQIRHLRHHRYHPISRYSDESGCKDCSGATFPRGDMQPRLHSGCQAEALTDHQTLGQRQIEALNDLEIDDFFNIRSCPVCGQDLGREASTDHWAFHRYNFKKQVQDKKSHLEVDGPEAESVLDRLERWKQGDSSESMHYMEEKCHMLENEVLEREEFCRICFESFEYGTGLLVKHYKIHHDEEKKQRDVVDEVSELILAEGTASHVSSLTSPATPLNVRVARAAERREKILHETLPVQASPRNQPFVASNFPFDLIHAAHGSSASTNAASTIGNKGTPSSQMDSLDFSFKRSPRAAMFAEQQGKKGKAPKSPATPNSSGNGGGRRKAAKRVDSVIPSSPSSSGSSVSKSSKVQKRKKST